MSKKKKVLVCFSDEILKKLDKKVRPYKRSAYINDVLSQHFRTLENEEKQDD